MSLKDPWNHFQKVLGSYDFSFYSRQHMVSVQQRGLVISIKIVCQTAAANNYTDYFQIAAMASCPCCAKAPRQQVVDRFCSCREVVEWMEEWRGKAGNSKKPHSAMFCSRSDVVGMGGAACRMEGGCHEKTEQCLMFFITAPYYDAMMPFVISDKKIFEKTVKLKETAVKVKKSAKKTTAAAIQERNSFEEHLDTTFKIIKEDYKDYIKKCPIR